MTKDVLSKRAKAAYQFIVDFKTANDGNSPTYDEIAEGIRVKAKSQAWSLVQELATAGLVRLEGPSRFIVVQGGEWRLAK